MPTTKLTNSSLFGWLLGYEAKRKKLLEKAPAGALRDFLSVPLPDIDTPIDRVEILAVDFETTGLDAKQDKLLSVGFITLKQQQMSLKTSYHQIIKTKAQLEESNVIIHHITDSQKEQGQALVTVVETLLKALAGKVMLVHFARIERQFLTEACYELYGMTPTFPMIDTLALAKRRLDKRDVAYDPSELRLVNLRHKFKLPEHHAHNALNDAIATAELFMAQMSKTNKDGKTTLKDVLL
ncbi:exonuclease domain-containing protein [Colwellia psychrerythraea]|uniref:Exonuclease RNase T and DNA polymerase III n=1 Tax=Colwellia psychrerythraea TaxID=28229 RepID=A0A099KN02_COLPS|nr:exonuclease domain-containing protein [Colwellia psychrerythraea]KGJ91023.1 Exonuclease RNase T and DNA polymerase III [Colwellia psychrerythraea]